MKRRASSRSPSSKPAGDGRERLQKVLAARGVASRRAAEKLMVEGRVLVDGLVVRELGTRVAPDATIEVDGRAIASAPARRYFALHKPLGVVSTVSDPQGRRTVRQLIREPGRFFPVGRLDADSTGLLLVTDDGEWAQRVLHPRYAQPREYEVRVRGRITEERLQRLRGGIRLEEGVSRLRSVRVTRLSERESVLRVELTQGWKRQVRRTLAAVGLPVVSLTRVRIGPLALGKLAPGEYRTLTSGEIRSLAPR
jgi:pseudouridine synthase